jgi:hypothetical protein
MLSLSVVAALAAAGWWWATWPERTAREFIKLINTEKLTEANRLLSDDSSYNGKRGSFVLGRLVVLGNDGRHIRSFPDERVQVTLLAPDGFNSATIRSIQKRHDNREVVELPDLDGDGYAENAFGHAVTDD